MGPLGRYAALGALAAAILTIGAAIAYRFVYPGSTDPTLDGWAYLSLGVVLGTVGGVYGGREEGQSAAVRTINGLGSKVDALHRRVDAVPDASMLTAAELATLRALLPR